MATTIKPLRYASAIMLIASSIMASCTSQIMVSAYVPISHGPGIITGFRPMNHFHPIVRSSSRGFHLSSSFNNDDDGDWGFEDVGGASGNDSYNDPRVDALRSILESSWDGNSMGVVPSNPEKAAEAAAESVALAMGRGHNVLMIDLRLPAYDITEGPKLYDIYAAYKFCSYLSERLIQRKLIRKSLVLARNERERAEIARSIKAKGESRLSDASEESYMGTSDGTEVDDFRRKLMSSWDSVSEEIGDDSTDSAIDMNVAGGMASLAKNINFNSHRLWSMVADEEFSSGPDMFDQVIAAADKHARVVDGQSTEPEDAIIILSPYDNVDVIAIRRILARYGQTRTIVIVNSRMENIPRELDSAVLVYGIMPLIARSRNSDGNVDEDGNEVGPKVVVMKRFPQKWGVF
ncbi:hypothetical protein ACHAXS_008582, partial [Conticribra weissflogii]